MDKSNLCAILKVLSHKMRITCVYCGIICMEVENPETSACRPPMQAPLNTRLERAKPQRTTPQLLTPLERKEKGRHASKAREKAVDIC